MKVKIELEVITAIKKSMKLWDRPIPTEKQIKTILERNPELTLLILRFGFETGEREQFITELERL